ncbi:MAG: glycosyltransferase family 2 protein [Thermoanaerobaculia bacterium]|nr:glycosyltransferase family 2 protein [Thermoanaerobaculia bacterium]
MGAPEISIVIPTRNTRESTLRTLASIESERDSANVEIIVVDDEGSDGTAEAISSQHPGVTLLRNANRMRFAGTANRGLRVARAPLVMCLNSDALLRPGSLRAIVAWFAGDPKSGIAGARLVDSRGNDEWSGGPEPTPSWCLVAASGVASRIARARGGARVQARVDWVAGTAMTIRREVLAEVGLFEESYAFYAQDLELCFRARRAGWIVGLVREATVEHERGTTVRQEAANADGVDLAALWSDLCLWASRCHGPRRAESFRRAIRTGAWIRLVLSPTVSERSRVRSALRQLRSQPL